MKRVKWVNAKVSGRGLDKWYSTGCADKNATGKGAEIHFNSLEHELLWDADILEHQWVLKSRNTQMRPWSRCRRSLIWKYLEVKECLKYLPMHFSLSKPQPEYFWQCYEHIKSKHDVKRFNCHACIHMSINSCLCKMLYYTVVENTCSSE